MRRVRISTWILTAIFVLTLVTYVMVKPPAVGTTGDTQQVHPTTSARAVPTTPPPMIATSQLMTALKLAHDGNATSVRQPARW